MTILNTTYRSTLDLKSSSNESSKSKLFQKIVLLYSFIILFILFFALLNFIHPLIMGRILREEVGLIAFVCFVSIQGSMELESEEKVSQDASEFYVKFVVYVIDLCLCINSYVRPLLVIFGGVISLFQLGLLYIRLLQPNTETKMKKNSLSPDMTLISANVLALTLIIGKGLVPSEIVIDVVKVVLIGGVLTFYISVMLAERVEEFMRKSKEIDDKNSLLIGFKIIKPLVSTVLGKFKKFRKIKGK